MNNYIITNGELYHHGVKGMKWGVRRAQKRNERADRTIRKLELTRNKNKLDYDEAQKESREIYSKKPKKLKKALAGDKAIYDTSEVTNNFLIAKQKAKKDKAYKQTDEYKKAKMAYGKQEAQKTIFGAAGHQRIETLKNMGKSEKAAKGRVVAEQALAAIAVTGIAAFSAYMENKYRQ